MEQILFKMFDNMSVKFDLQHIIQIIIIVFLTVGIYIALMVVTKQLKKKLPDYDDIRKRHFYITALRIAKALVIIIGVIAVLGAFGVNLSGFTTALGVFVVLFLLAVKDSLQDIFAGITIMMDKYFNVGDAVEFEGKDGIVVSFTIRTTKIELIDDKSVLSVSNRNISKIRKLTHLVDIDLPLPYELDRKDAYEVLEGICGQIRMLGGIESCELKGTQDFAESAIIYKVRFFCEPNERPDIRRAALKTIQDGLAAAGIHIPYNQIDVHTS